MAYMSFDGGGIGTAFRGLSMGYATTPYFKMLWNGNVGLSTGNAQGRLDVLAGGSAATDMAQIWRKGDGTIVSSVSATGVMMATKFVGDGSGLTGVAAGSYPGYINASQVNSGSFQNGAYTFPNTLTVTGAAAFNNPGATTSQANSFNSGTNAIAAMFGSGSTSGFTADQYGGAVRFNGAGVLWGDLSFYPNGGGSGNQGNFRFSTTGSILGTTPAGKVGVGELYSVGNVGIGTTNPDGYLHLSHADGNVNGDIKIQTTATDSRPNLRFSNDAQAMWIGVDGTIGDALAFGAGSVADNLQRMTILPGGNVGIGTTTPGAKLDVQGGRTFVAGLDATNNNSMRIMSTAGSNTYSGTGYIQIGYAAYNQAGLQINASGGLGFWTDGGGAWTQKMVLTNAGNLGIGTTGPTYLLHVNGTGYFNDRLTLGQNLLMSGSGSLGTVLISAHDIGTDQNLVLRHGAGSGAIKFQGWGGSAWVDRLTIANGGNVGIGTTGPVAKLQITAGSEIYSGGTYGSHEGLWLGSYGPNGGAKIDLNTHTSSISNSSWRIQHETDNTVAGNLVFLYAPTQEARSNLSYTEYLRINSSGNVGIGTTAPGQKLSILGAAIGGNTFSGISILDADSDRLRVGYNTLGPTAGLVPPQVVAGVSNLYLASRDISAGAIVFQTGSGITEKVRIQGDGNVGIGTTAPGAKLDVKETTNDWAGIGIQALTGTKWYVNAGISGVNNGEFAIGTNANGTTPALAILNSGNVGIGTTAPVGRLSVQSVAGAGNVVVANLNNPYQYGAGAGLAAAVLRFNHTPNDAGSTGVMADISGGNESETTSTVGYLAFGTRSGSTEVTAERMRITSGGNVGIGTTAPNTFLDLKGAEPEVLSTNPVWPKGTMQIEDSGAYASGSAPTIVFYKERDSSHNQTLVGAISGQGTYPNQSLQFYVGGGTDVGAQYLGAAPKMTILNGGNVGIGTAGPGQKLDVAGNINIGSSGYLYFTSRYGAANNGNILFNNGTAQNLILAETATNVYTFGGGATPGIVPTSVLSMNTSSGNVGIGTTSPARPLHVLGTNRNVARFETGGGSAQTFVEFINGAKTWEVGNHDGFSNYTDWGVRNQTDAINALNITANGNVGIGTTDTSAATLNVKGTIAFYYLASGTAYSICYAGQANGFGVLASCSSDERLKQNIASLNGSTALSQVMKLTPVSFNWNPKFSAGQPKQFGLTAQNVQKVWPNLVSTTSPTAFTPDGTLSINFNGLYAPIIASIQELNKRTSLITVTGSTATTSAPSPVLTLNASIGSVGIGTTSPGQALDVTGNIRTSGCLYYASSSLGTCASDLMLKKDVVPVTGALEKLSQLNPVRFEWKNQHYAEEHLSRGTQWGLVAQEVEKVLPELVSKDEVDGYKRVNYGAELNMMVIQAIKELKSENDRQQKENTALKSEVSSLKEKVKEVDQIKERLSQLEKPR